MRLHSRLQHEKRLRFSCITALQTTCRIITLTAMALLLSPPVSIMADKELSQNRPIWDTGANKGIQVQDQAKKKEPGSDSDAPMVQLFDVQEERVLTTRPNSSAFRNQVERWIQSAQHLSGRARLDTDAGIVIRIPLMPPLSVQLNWLTAQVTEVYLFIHPKEKDSPFLLLFSKEGKPYVIDITEYPHEFLKEHGLLRYIKDH